MLFGECVNLTRWERNKLLVPVAVMVAERRLKRGIKLNYPEADALITDYVLEGARDGRSVAELMQDGATVIGREQVMEGGGAGDDLRDPGGGDVPGRDQAGHRPRAGPVSPRHWLQR
jgi:urease subunit gamma